MTRVFHLISHFDMGGAERVAANIARSSTPGYEYHLVEVMRGGSPFTQKFVDEMRENGIACHRSWIPDIHFHFLVERMAALLFPLRFLWLYLRWHPDVVHCHTELPDMAFVATCKIFPWMVRRVGVVRTIHNTRLWTGVKGIGRVAERFFIHQGANVAISCSTQQCYADEYGVRPPIIYNGVPEVAPKCYPHLVKGKINVLFAGRLEEQKGISTLGEIVSRLSDDSRYHFHIIGDGRLKPLVEQRVAHQTNVSVGPPVFGLASFLAAFDYVLMPSEFEGLGILSVEASLAGTPTIINNCPGLRETLAEDWPLKVENNDVEAYVKLFKSVIPSADRAHLGACARQYALAHFSMRAMQLHYEQRYETVVSRLKSSAAIHKSD